MTYPRSVAYAPAKYFHGCNLRVTETARPSMVAMYVLGIAGYPFSAVVRQMVGLGAGHSWASSILRALIAISVASVLIGQRRGERVRYKGAWLWLLCFFWFCYLLRMAYDSYSVGNGYNHNLNGWGYVSPVSYFSYALICTLLPMIGFLVRPNRKELWIAFLLSYSMLAASCLLAVSMVATKQYLWDTGRAGFGTLNPIELGNAGAWLACLGLYLAMKAPWKLLARLILGVAGVLLGIYTMLLSGSRGPLLSALLAAALLVWWTAKTRAGRLSVAIVTATVAMAIAILAFSGKDLTLLLKTTSVMTKRTTRDTNDLTDYYRTTLLLNAAREAIHNPLFGSGIAEKESGDYPHNLLIEAFMATGMFGGIAFSWVFYRAIRALLSMPAVFECGLWVGLLFVQSCVEALFSGAIWGSYELWCTAAAVMSMAGFAVVRRYRLIPLYSSVGPWPRDAKQM